MTGSGSSSVMQVNTKKNCDPISDYPFVLYNTFGALVDGKVVVCGGDSGAVVTAVCHAYDHATNEWDYAGAMARKRTRATAVSMSGGAKMLVAGGTNGGELLQSTEIYSGGRFSAGPEMPLALAHQCLVWVGGNKYFMAGGTTSEMEASTKAWILDMDTQGWTKVPDLNIGRKNPMCGKTADGEVFVAGGTRLSGSKYQTSRFVLLHNQIGP